MEPLEYFKAVVGAILTAFFAAIGWLVRSVLSNSKDIEKQNIRVSALEEASKLMGKIPERLTAVETEVKLSFRELSNGLNRIENFLTLRPRQRTGKKEKEKEGSGV